MTLIKEHLCRYQVIYISATSSMVVAGVTWFIMRKNTGLLCGPGFELLSESKEPGKVAVNSTARSFSFNFLTKDSGNQKTRNNIYATIHNGNKGSSGFITRSLDTGQLFETQKAAAEAFEIPQSILSSHLNGKFDDAIGYHFERIGVLT